MARLAALVVIGILTVGVLSFPGVQPLLDPLEHKCLFSPRPGGAERLTRVASRDSGLEEVRLATPDGVILHGWLKRPAKLRRGERYPLVIVYGGVRREPGRPANGAGCW